jgi:hypothetical protein
VINARSAIMHNTLKIPPVAYNLRHLIRRGLLE